MQSAVKRRRLIGKQKADHFDRQKPEDDDLELIIVDHFDRQKPEDDDLELIIVEPQGGPAKRHHLQAARHGLEPRTFRKMLRFGLPNRSLQLDLVLPSAWISRRCIGLH